MTLTFPHYDATAAASAGLVDRLVAVYLDVHADDDSAFYGEDRFRRQLSGHMSAPGWEVVTAADDGDVVGFAYGFPLGAETHWWDGLVGKAPEGFTVETGHRTFALSELMVLPAWRGHGLASRLHEELLSGRPEERATLLVRPDNTTAQEIYARWGWHKAAEVRPGWEDAPQYGALILPLHQPSNAS